MQRKIKHSSCLILLTAILFGAGSQATAQAAVSGATPSSTPSTLKLQTGEIMLEGVIQDLSAGDTSFMLQAMSFTLLGKPTRAIEPPKSKTVVFKSQAVAGATPLRVGARVQVVGIDTGSGKPLTARAIVLLADKNTTSQKEAATNSNTALALRREAMATADQISDAGAKARALSTIGLVCARLGSAPDATQAFAIAKQAAQSIAKPEEKSAVLRDIGNAQAQGGDKVEAKLAFASARQLVAPIPAPGLQIVALAELAASQALAGEQAAAVQNFATARQIAESITDIPTRVFAFCDINAAKVRAGDVDGAKAMLQAAQQTCDQFSFGGETNVRYWKDRMRGMAIIRALIRTIGLADAHTMAAGIMDDYMKSSAYLAIENAQAKAHDFASAKATVELITNPFLKTLAMADIAINEAQTGAPGAVERANAFNRARATVGQVTDPGLQAEALSTLAVAQAKFGDVPGARQAAAQIIDPYWKAVTLARIAEAISGK